MRAHRQAGLNRQLCSFGGEGAVAQKGSPSRDLTACVCRPPAGMTLPTKQTATTTALRPSKNLVNLPGIWILEWGYSDIFETASKVCETRRIPVTIPIRGVAEHTQQPAVCEMLEYMYRGACSATRRLFPPSQCTKRVFTPALLAALRFGKRRRTQNLRQPSTRSVTSTKALRRKRGIQSACSLCEALFGPPSQTPSASHLSNLSVLRNPASFPRRGPWGPTWRVPRKLKQPRLGRVTVHTRALSCSPVLNRIVMHR